MNSPDILTLAKLFLLHDGDERSNYEYTIDHLDEESASGYLLVRRKDGSFYLRVVMRDGEEEVVG